MSQLNNLFISSSYQGLLKMKDSTNGLTNTLQQVQTGDGMDSPLQISTTDVNISGSFFINGNPVIGSTSGTSGTSGSSGSNGTDGSSGTSGSSGTGFIYKSVWDNATTYNSYDVVNYGGQSYVALSSNTNKQPSVWPSIWSVFSAAGTSGTSGSSGSDGTSGSNGTDGSSGTSGSDGSSGTSGSDGSSGTSGSDGSSGTNGSDGTSGSNGTDGSSGTSGNSLFAQTGSFYATTNDLQVTGSVILDSVTGNTLIVSGGYMDPDTYEIYPSAKFQGGVELYEMTDISGSVISPYISLQGGVSGALNPNIGISMNTTDGGAGFGSVLISDPTLGYTVGMALSKYNTSDNSLGAFYYGAGLSNNTPGGPGSNDNSIMYTKPGDNYLRITRDTQITGSLNVNGNSYQTGTFYADAITFVNSPSIVEQTGSYIMTYDSTGSVTYDTYPNVAQALSPYITGSSGGDRNGLITTGSIGEIQSITGSLNLTSIDNTTITDLPLVSQNGGGSTIYVDYNAFNNSVFNYFINNNFDGVVVNGTGVSNATVTGFDYGDFVEIYLSSGTVTNGDTYTFTGNYPIDLNINSNKINVTGSVHSSQGYNTPSSYNVQNEDGTGVPFGSFNINCSGVDPTTNGVFSSLNIVGNSSEETINIALSNYTPMYGNEAVPTIYAGGYYDGLYGNTDTTMTFYSSSIQMWKPTQFKAPVAMTGSVRITGSLYLNDSPVGASDRNGLITTGSAFSDQQIQGTLRVSGSANQPLQILAGDNTARIDII